MTGNMAKGFALRNDSAGNLRDAFIALARNKGQAYLIPGKIVRYNPAFLPPDVLVSVIAEFPNGTPRGMAVDASGRLLVGVSHFTGVFPSESETGGYVLRFAADLSTSEVIWTDGARIPWALAVQPDGKILVGWNLGAINNSGNGITLDILDGIAGNVHRIPGVLAPGGQARWQGSRRASLRHRRESH